MPEVTPPTADQILTSPVWQSLRKRLVASLVKHALLHGDFTLASGAKSKIYLDVRRLSLRRDGMILIGKLMWPLYNSFRVDAVGGPTSGADPIVASILTAEGAGTKDVRGFFIRKEAKGHGTGKQIEGAVTPGDRVVIVEDVTTSGGSAWRAVCAALDNHLKPVAVLTVVDREQGGAELFAEKKIPFYSLATMTEILGKEGPDNG